MQLGKNSRDLAVLTASTLLFFKNFIAASDFLKKMNNRTSFQVKSRF